MELMISAGSRYPELLPSASQACRCVLNNVNLDEIENMIYHVRAAEGWAH